MAHRTCHYRQGSNEVQHLIVKPMDVGLRLHLWLTNRRTYHIGCDHTGVNSCRVSVLFIPKMHWLNGMQLRHRRTGDWKSGITHDTETGEYLGNLDFAYSVSGNAVWKPVRVYNDGQKPLSRCPKSWRRLKRRRYCVKP
ncbi:MAG: TrbG/VirB9 family P-type conjugative transfer protein [Burkholderiales bacterium]|nr:TrbG/VirB9 family P-type conjugative transfer protein [Burkholderiales bacterium]